MHCVEIAVKTTSSFPKASTNKKFLTFPEDLNEIFSRAFAFTEYFIVERDGLKGVIDKNGNDILPPIYTEIIQSGSDFLASKEGRLEYFDFK